MANVLASLFGQAVDHRPAQLIANLLLVLSLANMARLWLTILPMATRTFPTDDSMFIRDFVQDYLLARAFLDSRSPYEPLVSLIGMYLPSALDYALPNPSPHPPTLISFIWPLGLLPYEGAALVWIAIQALAIVVLSVFLAAGCDLRRRPSPRAVFATLLLLHLWSPVVGDLIQGQLMLVIAALLAVGWSAYRGGSVRAAGALVGVVACLKIVPIALALYFLVRRQFRVAAWIGVVCFCAVGACVLRFGPGVFGDYLFAALPRTSEVWIGASSNSSVFALFARAAGDLDSVFPRLGASRLAFPVALAVSGSVVGLFARWAFQRVDDDVELAAFVIAVILVSPLVWRHYYSLIVWPIALLGQRIARRGWPQRDLLLLILAAMTFNVSASAILVNISALLPIPGAASTPDFLPAAGIGTLIWLLWRERDATRVDRRGIATGRMVS